MANINPESEPSKRVNILLTPEDQQIAGRLMVEYHQRGMTGLVRALLLEEAKRRGWPSPYATEKPTAEAAEARREGQR